MPEPLTELQRRVLGVLMEKALAQPTYYPLTLNALVAGCNQKSNRDPVMELDEATAWDTIEELRGRELASRVMPGAGSRTDKFRHDAGRTFDWTTPQLAIMAELLLRGPQTVGELRTRCGRMHKFESVEAVSAELEKLAGGDTPFVTTMPRTAGQSAVRFRHMLYEPDEVPAAASDAVPAAAPQAHAPARTPTPATPAMSAPAADTSIAWSEILDGLQVEIGELHEELGDLRRRLERIEERLG